MALDRMDRQLQDIATGDPTFLSLYRDFLSQLLSTLPALQSSVTAFQLAELTGHPLGRLPTQRNLVLERLSLFLRTHTQLSQGTALTAMDVDWYVETPHKSLIDFLGSGHVHPQLSVSAAEGHAILTRQHEQFLLVPLGFSSSAQVYLHLHGCTHAAYCVVLEDDHPCCRLAIAEWKSAMHDKKLQAINFQAVGKVLDDLGAYAKGEMFLQTAANLWRECGQWVKYLRALIALGAVQHRATHYDAAMKLFDQLSLDVVERGQADASWDATDAVRLLCSLADCCRSQRSSDAEKYINQALELAQRNSNKLLIARCLNLKGVIHHVTG
jgi:tetratricopeptide (TPR) repeat protein